MWKKKLLYELYTSEPVLRNPVNFIRTPKIHWTEILVFHLRKFWEVSHIVSSQKDEIIPSNKSLV